MRVQGFGKRLFIWLPTKFIAKNNLKKGDDLSTIIFYDGELRLSSPKANQELRDME